MSLRERYAEYRDNRIRRDAFLSWAKDELGEGEVITISFPGITEHYRVVKSEFGRDIERIKKGYPHYIVCAAGTGEEIQKSYEQETRTTKKRLWRRFFSTPLFEIWEEVGRWKGEVSTWQVDTSNELPLRHGLTDTEKLFLLNVARKNITHYLHTGKQLPATIFTKESGRLKAQMSAAVAIWHRGETRGCMIIFNEPCVESVLKASMRVLSDTRYRPLTVDELPDVRLEITLFSNLGMPLLPTDFVRNDIYYDKAFCAEQGRQIAWYLPEVFNLIQFDGLKGLTDHLARKKGGFSPVGASTSIFEVEDFIESADHTSSLSLEGPIPRGVPRGGLGKLEYRKLFDNAADHLAVLVGETGHIPSLIDPFDIRVRNKVSLSRSAFTAYALLEYASATNSSKYRAAGEKAFEAVVSRLPVIATNDRLAIDTYLGMAALILGRNEDMARFQKLVMQSPLLNQKIQTIAFLQAARFLGGSDDRGSQLCAQMIFEKVLADFRLKQESDAPISLAEYADMLIVSRQLGDKYKVEQKEISEWYESYQLEEGSFPNTTHGGLPYTRGTGKIFESLSYDSAQHSEVLNKALGWLVRMQYTEDSAYFIPLGSRPLCLGGFRHDIKNIEAWPDAAGHVLIGAARLIQAGFSFRDRPLDPARDRQ